MKKNKDSDSSKKPSYNYYPTRRFLIIKHHVDKVIPSILPEKITATLEDRHFKDITVIFDDCKLHPQLFEYLSEQSSGLHIRFKDCTFFENQPLKPDETGLDKKQPLKIENSNHVSLEFSRCKFANRTIQISRSEISLFRLQHSEIVQKIYFQSVAIKSCEFTDSMPKLEFSQINFENSAIGVFSLSCGNTRPPCDKKTLKITTKSETAPRTNITKVPFHVELECNNSIFPILKIAGNSSVDVKLKNCEVHDLTICSASSYLSKILSNHKISLLQCTFKNDVDLSALGITQLASAQIDLSYSKISRQLALPSFKKVGIGDHEWITDDEWLRFGKKHDTGSNQLPDDKWVQLGKAQFDQFIREGNEPPRASYLKLAFTECDILSDSLSCWPKLGNDNCMDYQIHLPGFRYNYLQRPNFDQQSLTSQKQPNQYLDENSYRQKLVNLWSKSTKTFLSFCEDMWGFSNATVGSRIEIMLKNPNVLHSTDALGLSEKDEQCQETNSKYLISKDEKFNAFGWHILQTALSNMGMAPEAQDLSIKRRLSARANASVTEKLTSWLFEISANFGYNPFRAILWFFILFVLFTLCNLGLNYLHYEQIFISNSCSNALQTPSEILNFEALSIIDSNCIPIHPAEIVGYSVDWLIPIFDFGFETQWNINRAAPYSTFLAWIFFFFRLVGAYLIAITLVSFSGYLNQDR